VESAEDVELISRVFWFTLECGLVRQGRDIKVFGASLLSSCGEMAQFEHAEIRPLDLGSMATQSYRPDVYQEVLFCADSFAHMEDFLSGFLSSVRPEGLRQARC
jgi:phenylalanine-4-hydroxylase